MNLIYFPETVSKGCWSCDQILLILQIRIRLGHRYITKRSFQSIKLLYNALLACIHRTMRGAWETFAAQTDQEAEIRKYEISCYS